MNIDHIISAPQIRAILGRHNIHDSNDKNGTVREILKNHIHPEYDSQVHDPLSNVTRRPKSYADIAILIMKEEVDFSDHIQPICLPTLSFEVFGIEGVTAGYGKVDASSSNQPIARYVTLRTIDLVKCYASAENSGNVVSEKSFCTQKGDVTLCQGL